MHKIGVFCILLLWGRAFGLQLRISVNVVSPRFRVYPIHAAQSGRPNSWHSKKTTGQDLIPGLGLERQSIKSQPARPAHIEQLLRHPQLLVKYRVPKIKTDRKIELEASQLALKGASAQDNPVYRVWREGGRAPAVRTTERGGAPAKPSTSSAARTAPARRGPARGKNEDRGRPTEESGREEGKLRLPQSAQGKAGRGARGLGELMEEDAADAAEDAEEEQVQVLTGLAGLPPGLLLSLQQDGLTLEEILACVYAEYGVTSSISAVKRRMEDEKLDKASRRRSGKTRRERAKARRPAVSARPTHVPLSATAGVTVKDLAALMGQEDADSLIQHLVTNEGMSADESLMLDPALARRVCAAFGLEITTPSLRQSQDKPHAMAQPVAGQDARSPVVTVMGHVDHGKTSLLDRIRSTSVAKREAGGITQALSAFQVALPGGRAITFLDTPGHAAFSAMRKRGAAVTDIVVLVVAADDGVMEQTKECIAAAKHAGCPIVVAVNKMDKEGAVADAVKTQLMSEDVLVEDFGGETQCGSVSARTGAGVEDLLNKILLQAEVMDLRASRDGAVAGTVLEVRRDKGLGMVVTAIVRSGTLRVGDLVLAGSGVGKVRRLLLDTGLQTPQAGPSIPVQIVGMDGLPGVGDELVTVQDESQARSVAAARAALAKQAAAAVVTSGIRKSASDTISTAEGVSKKGPAAVPVLVKADVLGSLEAVLDSLAALRVGDEAASLVDVVYSGLGDVTSSDVSVAGAVGASIFTFNVGSTADSKAAARGAGVRMVSSSVIYELLDEAKKMATSVATAPAPGLKVGQLLVKKVFTLGKTGKVAGCEITEGMITSASSVLRISRAGAGAIFTGPLSSLKSGKEAVVELTGVGTECGLSFGSFTDIAEGDVIECFLTSSPAHS